MMMRTMTMLLINSDGDDYDNCDNDMTVTMTGLPLYVCGPLEKCASPSSPSTRLDSAFRFCLLYQMDL